MRVHCVSVWNNELEIEQGVQWFVADAAEYGTEIARFEKSK